MGAAGCRRLLSEALINARTHPTLANPGIQLPGRRAVPEQYLEGFLKGWLGRSDCGSRGT